jgi:small subunit ribosomal protein S9
MTTKKSDTIKSYYEGIGRRKTSTARVRLYPTEKKEMDTFVVNDKGLQEFFSLDFLRTNAKAPLNLLADKIFDVTVKVQGGGITGQSDAIKLGLGRALLLFDETLKKELKDRGFLTRDSRKKERKKPGFKKARRAPQWAKR